jgi:hypothetical protein
MERAPPPNFSKGLHREAPIFQQGRKKMARENRVWSEEQEKALQGFLPMRPAVSFGYVPKVFRKKREDGGYLFEKEDWPVFTLRVKDGIQSAEMEDSLEAAFDGAEVSGLRMNSGSTRIQILRSCIVNCKNWKDATGAAVPFKRDATKKGNPVADEFLRELPPALQVELADAITERSELSPEEVEGLKF